MTAIAIITTLAATFFFETALYVTLVEHSARMKRGTSSALEGKGVRSAMIHNVV